MINNAGKATIEKSIARIGKLIHESYQVNDQNVPLPSWIELTVMDTCNRKCVFCPRGDDTIVPDQPHKMRKALYTKMATELEEIGFRGTIMLAGYGEPLLNKEICDIVKSFSSFCNVEVTTNGDPLTEKTITKLIDAGIGQIVVSMYEGEHQIDEFKTLFEKAGAPNNRYSLRDRWYSEDEDFGLELSNRAGVLSELTGSVVDVNNNSGRCFYPSYSMMVNWNGDVFLCTMDWNRRVSTGNLMFDTVYEIWTGKILTRYRNKLLNGSRDLSPCNRCDSDGCKQGAEHAAGWADLKKNAFK
jgi:MoaA/NifB/PqqE/SkfB family radical SAM enzyme